MLWVIFDNFEDKLPLRSFLEKKYPFNEFDLRSFKIIEILGTSSEIKMHCMGWLISTKKKCKIMIQVIYFLF